MRDLLSVQRILLIAVVLLVLLSGTVRAQWITDGVPVCGDESGQVLPCIVTDGSGGAIIAWQERRGVLDDMRLYVQRVDGYGVIQWTTSGVLITSTIEPNSGPNINVDIASDGAGGAIITWQDNRLRPDYNIYAQRVDPSGTLLWASGGVSVCSVAESQLGMSISPDGAGGAVITWTDYRSGSNWDIYAQRINSAGVVQWAADGVAVCTEEYSQSRPDILCDDLGYSIITWQDHRISLGIYAQRLSLGGSTMWTTGGIEICTAPDSQLWPELVSDGNRGAIILWRTGIPMTALYAQKVLSSGTTVWTTDGVLISNDSDIESPQITADGNDGAIISWHAVGRLPGTWDYQWGIFVSRITGSGVFQWGASGVVVYQVGQNGTSFWLTNGPLVTDGEGGAILTWTEDEDLVAGGGLHAQRLDADGTLLWDPNGKDVCTAFNFQEQVQVVSDGYKGAVLAWKDYRNLPSGMGTQIFANRVYELECEVSATVDFGTVVIGDYYDRGFYIYNRAGYPLTGSVSEACPDFNIEYTSPPDNPYVLEQGEQLYVVVRFEPTTTGTQMCTIETGDMACSDVECTGIGFDCPVGLVYVDADATGVGDGSSWADAFTELRDVLDLTDLCTGINEIWVAEGTYTPTAGTDRSASFELVNGISIYGGFDGTETELSERDFDAHETILSGDLGGVNSYHVMTAGSGINTTARLDGLTIREGVADGAADSEQRGGGFYNVEGVPSLNNLIITNNQASLGGGLYSEGGTARLYQCTFQWNTATSTGAGMYNSDGDLFMRNVTFRYNNGRALYNTSGNGTLRECIFEHNNGGGIYNNASSAPVIINTIFFENTDVNGAGIWNANGCAPQLINVTFYNNTATTSGGALQNGKFSNPVITNSIFWGNSAPASPEIGNNMSFPVISYSLIDGCGGSGGGWDTALGTDSGNNIDADPNFKLSHSSDPYLSLWSSSPAINAGSNAAVIYMIDLAGNPRTYDATVDLGAYEHQAGTTTDVDEDLPQVPEAFALYQNSPNPFNPVTRIRFDLPRQGYVRLVVYNVKGELVATLADQNMDAGRKEITWDAKDSAGRTATSGVYFYRLVAGEFIETKKMILLR